MMEYIYFNSRDELLRLRITEIAYFESDGNYCNVSRPTNCAVRSA